MYGSLLAAERGASISCWWMSFKENEGEEGQKRGKKLADKRDGSIGRYNIVFTLCRQNSDTMGKP